MWKITEYEEDKALVTLTNDFEIQSFKDRDLMSKVESWIEHGYPRLGPSDDLTKGQMNAEDVVLFSVSNKDKYAFQEFLQDQGLDLVKF